MPSRAFMMDLLDLCLRNRWREVERGVTPRSVFDEQVREYEQEFGVLPPMLAELEIPAASQEAA